MLPSMESVAAAPGVPAQSRSRAITLLLLTAWIGFTVVLGLLYARVPPNPDQATFDYIGWIVGSGGHVYVDATEINFPGQMWINAVSTILFGHHVWSYRVFDYLMMLGGAFLLASLLRTKLGTARALLVVPLYQVAYVTAGWWMAGQRDIVASHLLFAAGLAYRARLRGASRGWLAAFALAVTYATLIRPTYGVFAFFIVLMDYLTRKENHRSVRMVIADGSLAAAVCIALLAALALGGWRSGALAAWHEGTIRFMSEVNTRESTHTGVMQKFVELLAGWHWYFGFAVAGAWLWWRDGRDRSALHLVATLALTVATSAEVLRKGFGYHWGGMLPVLITLDAYFIWWCIDFALQARTARRVALAGVVCGIAVLGMAKKVRGSLGPQIAWTSGAGSAREMFASLPSGVEGASYADVIDASEYLRATVPPQGTVMVLNRLVQLNFMSERRSPTRFPTIFMLIHAREGFSRVAEWTREVELAFAQRPPEVIVMTAGEENEEMILADPKPSPPVAVIRRELASHFRKEKAFGALEVYRRQRPGQ